MSLSISKVSLCDLVESKVDAKTRHEGDLLFKCRGFELVSEDSGCLELKVGLPSAGSKRNTVSIERELDDYGSIVYVECNCRDVPQGADDVCAHMWAALRETEGRSIVSDLGPLSNDLEFEFTHFQDGLSESYAEDEVRVTPRLGLSDYGDESESDEMLGNIVGSPSGSSVFRRAYDPPVRSKASWELFLENVRYTRMRSIGHRGDTWPRNQEIAYLLEPAIDGISDLAVKVFSRRPKKSGGLTAPVQCSMFLHRIEDLPDERDRRILSQLGAANGLEGSWSADRLKHRMVIPDIGEAEIVQLMAETGRLWVAWQMGWSARPVSYQDWIHLSWDSSGWEFCLELLPITDAREYALAGSFRKGDERVGLEDVRIVSQYGFVLIQPDRLIGYERADVAYQWIENIREHREIRVPESRIQELVNGLMDAPVTPRVVLPDELKLQEVVETPIPHLKVTSGGNGKKLSATLSFMYGDRLLKYVNRVEQAYFADERVLVRRDVKFEDFAAGTLDELGLKRSKSGGKDAEFTLGVKDLGRVVTELTEANWYVEADGKVYRALVGFDVKVKSGIDWFEVHGDADFGEQQVGMPMLLKAVKQGENTVTLDDGSVGMLPNDWLNRYAVMADIGDAMEDHIKFKPSQVGLLDALLAAQPQVSYDEVFEDAKRKLYTFEGVEPVSPSRAFEGELRKYQKEGLGWLNFLREFKFGGCLADDMGLGKTVQVLAMLQGRREELLSGEAGESVRPALIVVPSSLVFNWCSEAERFTPDMKVLVQTGIQRAKDVAEFDDYAIVLTTYGTLRRDVTFMKDYEFDYVILDEAQAVKNAATAASKAVRLLQGRHRLALTGTPVENHLGELWTLFEFINPGMLGQRMSFMSNGKSAAGISADSRLLIAKGLRPFLLRRNKNDVATDLPDKLEQTLYCELDKKQRKVYDELRDHYRNALLGAVDSQGLGKSKIQVLEALLRLRQAACHPGLVNKDQVHMESAKMDVLLNQISEVVEEGHKALVFSQFTSFLAIVKDALDKAGIAYEYLDGKTRKRDECVDRFQNDPDCKLFLISLKAGGVGLNLTAAEYVFLLDPWWNPAVEAQAIDRAHRIGQTQQVFAYRLIARDTVEEKVLELQQTKRDLADAIITQDNSLIRDLSRDDLEMLLS